MLELLSIYLKYIFIQECYIFLSLIPVLFYYGVLYEIAMVISLLSY